MVSAPSLHRWLLEVPPLGLVEPVAGAEAELALAGRGVKRLQVHPVRLRPDHEDGARLLVEFHPVVTRTAQARPAGGPDIRLPGRLPALAFEADEFERETAAELVVGDDRPFLPHQPRDAIIEPLVVERGFRELDRPAVGGV